MVTARGRPDQDRKARRAHVALTGVAGGRRGGRAPVPPFREAVPRRLGSRCNRDLRRLLDQIDDRVRVGHHR